MNIKTLSKTQALGERAKWREARILTLLYEKEREMTGREIQKYVENDPYFRGYCTLTIHLVCQDLAANGYISITPHLRSNLYRIMPAGCQFYNQLVKEATDK